MRALALAAVLLFVAATSALAQMTEFFPVTASGSFDTCRSSPVEGYTNGGGYETGRLFKANEAMGWMSLAGSLGDKTGMTLSQFLAANPGATASLEFRCASVPLGTAGAYILSIRAGNAGTLIPDAGKIGNRYSSPATGFAGASELVAFRAAAKPGVGFQAVGDGIYIGNDPAAGGGKAWITPSSRAPGAGMAPFTFGPHEPIRYDTGNGATATGLYRGWFPNLSATDKRNYWALEDLLGLSNPSSNNAAWSDIQAAGQIWNTDTSGNPLLVNNAFSGTPDLRNISGQNLQDWTAVPISSDLLTDLANNPENKGLAFSNTINSQTADYSNVEFCTSLSMDYAPYLVVTTPEPATLSLLALASLLIPRTLGLQYHTRRIRE